ncbi:hypothetical protein BDEG_26650 [Batrachochytrium dendrobatidis JEL423]|nr:hypothetical protein BDEG_26650 [Batrachochytrium dendrobatidis JEL423]
MESSTAVDSAVTAVKPKGSRYEIQIGDASNQKILKASVPLCMLQTSRFHEMITVHVDSHGKPFHLDYLVNANECLPDIDFGKTLHFKTVVAVGRLADAPRPILEKLKETVDGQEPVPEQSFIQKYWYYIIPIMLVLTLSSSGGDDGKGEKPAAAKK